MKLLSTIITVLILTLSFGVKSHSQINFLGLQHQENGLYGHIENLKSLGLILQDTEQPALPNNWYCYDNSFNEISPDEGLEEGEASRCKKSRKGMLYSEPLLLHNCYKSCVEDFLENAYCIRKGIREYTINPIRCRGEQQYAKRFGSLSDFINAIGDVDIRLSPTVGYPLSTNHGLKIYEPKSDVFMDFRRFTVYRDKEKNRFRSYRIDIYPRTEKSSFIDDSLIYLDCGYFNACNYRIEDIEKFVLKETRKFLKGVFFNRPKFQPYGDSDRCLEGKDGDWICVESNGDVEIHRGSFGEPPLGQN